MVEDNALVWVCAIEAVLKRSSPLFRKGLESGVARVIVEKPQFSGKKCRRPAAGLAGRVRGIPRAGGYGD